MADERHDFMERADEVMALEGEFLQLHNGVEVKFPSWLGKKFLYKNGVAPLDAYIQAWRECYFHNMLSTLLAD